MVTGTGVTLRGMSDTCRVGRQDRSSSSSCLLPRVCPSCHTLERSSGVSTAILGSDRVCYGYEHSEVDPEERTMTMRTRNLTFASTVSMDERLVYSPDPNNSGNTVLRQETIITVKGVPLTSYMENYLINSISNNSFKGRDALEFVISKINHEVEELVSTYKRSTSEILDHTKRSLGEITESAMRSVDDISSAAKKSVDGLSDAAKKSIDDISCVAKKGIDTFTQPTSPGPMPRI